MEIFYIFTPLHALIAASIIKQNNIKIYSAIYNANNNKKNRYYYRLISKNAINKHFIDNKYIVYSALKTLFLSIYYKVKYPKLIIFYTGNLKNFNARLFLLLHSFQLYTFDDGGGNINPHEKAYFRDNNEGQKSYYFFNFLKRKLLYKNLINNIERHYTIFSQPNIYENSTKINLLIANIKDSEKRAKKAINILLTSSYSEDKIVSLKNEIIIYNEVISEYIIDYVIVHPREKFSKLIGNQKDKIIESDLIAEQIILNYNRTNTVHVFGFNCSTLYILESITNDIKIHNLGTIKNYL